MRPGEKKVQPLNLSQLRDRIQSLDHGKKRSDATGAVHHAYSGALSRRSLDAMVRQVRNEKRPSAALRDLSGHLVACEPGLGHGRLPEKK